jgi:uncharacterized RDD family membrane protein YckC
MTSRFDELDLLRTDELVPTEREVAAGASLAPSEAVVSAPRWRRALALGTDLSLFAALALALSPLLPGRGDLMTVIERDLLPLSALTGFLLLVSFYYFVCSWLIWGRTIGGAIFDVRVSDERGQPIEFRKAAVRWVVTLASLLTGGLGFLPALARSGRTAADRISASRSVRD